MDKRVAKVIELMRESSDGKMSPEELAQAVNLSPSRLHELFKCETGTSPVKYLKALRLEHARALLESTFLSVKEIRARVGEGDESHFTRDFKRAFGVTPTQYRARRNGARRAADAAAQQETNAPDGFVHASEHARPELSSGPTADESVAAKVRRLLLRIKAGTLLGYRPKFAFRLARRLAQRALQRPAGERLSMPLIFRPTGSVESVRGPRVTWPRYRSVRRLRSALRRPPSLYPPAARPSWGSLRLPKNTTPAIP